MTKQDKLKCPYCGEDIDIDTDDMEEYEVHEYQCEGCGKYSMGIASISWSYNIKKLDCKNGLEDHKYEDVLISSRGYTIRRCKVCGKVK